MATTRLILLPNAAELPSSANAQLAAVGSRQVLAFDAASEEECRWVFMAPQGITPPLTLVISYMMASAISGDIIMMAQIEAVTDGDATDLDATTSFDTVNTAAAVTVPGTAGYLDQVTITLTNNDSIAAGDYARLRLLRDADNVSDTASGDVYVLVVELRDSA